MTRIAEVNVGMVIDANPVLAPYISTNRDMCVVVSMTSSEISVNTSEPSKTELGEDVSWTDLQLG